jgi:hypothetical protein
MGALPKTTKRIENNFKNAMTESGLGRFFVCRASEGRN